VRASADIAWIPVGAPDPSFHAFVREHLAYVWRVACALAGESVADDLTQETFLVARRRIGSFDGEHPRAWLFRIASNVARNTKRADRRRIDRLRVVEEPAPQRTPEEQLAVEEAARLMEVFLRRLSPRKRVAFFLVELEGLAPREAAVALGVPCKTIHSRVHSARAELEVFRQRLVAPRAEVGT
jgi:RNA polymerase sigma-70 factor (ECF subfamily)